MTIAPAVGAPVHRSIVDIFCDESCHLPNDRQRAMTLGALSLSHDLVRTVTAEIRELKKKHGVPTDFEVKWSKVSPGKLPLYVDLVEFFFAKADLRFRALVAKHKEQLDHERFQQDHDTWYHKMYYETLSYLLDRDHVFRIYIDIKDTRGGPKAEKLHDVLAYSIHDFDKSVVERVQILRSHELEPLQLADLLLGAVSAAARQSVTSAAKSAVIQLIEQRVGRRLSASMPLGERKFNVFHWTPRTIAGP